MRSTEYRPGTLVWCNGYQGVVTATNVTPGGRIEVRIASGSLCVDPKDQHEVRPRGSADVERKKLEALVWRHTPKNLKTMRPDRAKILMVKQDEGDPAPADLRSLTDLELMKKLPIDVIAKLR